MEFELFKSCGHSERYPRRLEKRMFDVYLPGELLGSAGAPQKLLLALMRSCRQPIGFGRREEVPVGGPLRYGLGPAVVNSKVFTATQWDRKHKLYVPNEVFAREAPPPSLYLLAAPYLPATPEVSLDDRVAALEDRVARLERAGGADISQE
ncbi:MAG: hypothetical protein ACRD01_04200 [Terriglobales bacterium]